MYDLKTMGPTPDNLATRVVFEKVKVPMARLAEAAGASGLKVSDRQFRDCLILGPCVIAPAPDTRFEQCNMGDTGGDVNNLFLRASGPGMVGVIPVPGCTFEGCLFLGVGFAGGDAFVEGFAALLSRRES